MATPVFNGQVQSTVAVEVGSRLRERRNELGLGLREAAAAAETSPSHLSDIENGRSHVSLPVLLRLCKSLRLPVARLLPRLGGHRVLQSSLENADSSEKQLSHPDLHLSVASIDLVPRSSYQVRAGAEDEEVFAFVLDGTCQADIDGNRYSLGPHDAIDIENAVLIKFQARKRCRLLVCRGTRR